MKARCMITLPPGDQKEFVSPVPLLDTVRKSIQAFAQELGFRTSASDLGCRNRGAATIRFKRLVTCVVSVVLDSSISWRITSLKLES